MLRSSRCLEIEKIREVIRFPTLVYPVKRMEGRINGVGLSRLSGKFDWQTKGDR